MNTNILIIRAIAIVLTLMATMCGSTQVYASIPDHYMVSGYVDAMDAEDPTNDIVYRAWINVSINTNDLNSEYDYWWRRCIQVTLCPCDAFEDGRTSVKLPYLLSPTEDSLNSLLEKLECGFHPASSHGREYVKQRLQTIEVGSYNFCLAYNKTVKNVYSRALASIDEFCFVYSNVKKILFTDRRYYQSGGHLIGGTLPKSSLRGVDLKEVEIYLNDTDTGQQIRLLFSKLPVKSVTLCDTDSKWAEIVANEQ